MSMHDGATLPHSPAAERNRGPIGIALDARLAQNARVLEFAAGSGQHASHMAALRPDLRWLATDRSEVLGGLVARVASTPQGHLLTPREVDLLDPATQEGLDDDGPFDACFAANVLHVTGMDAVAALFGIAGHVLRTQGDLLIYGPINVDGAFTSDGNRAFDSSLREADANHGIRELAELDALAMATGFARAGLERLPANNHLMHWQKRSPPA